MHRDVTLFAKKSSNKLKYIKFYIIIRVRSAFSLVVTCVLLESLSKRRFCQHGRLPEVNRAVIDGE